MILQEVMSEMNQKTMCEEVIDSWPIDWGVPEVLPCATEMLNRNVDCLSTYLQRVISGDYGLSDRGDGWMNELRRMGRRFSATYEMKDNTLLYISVNEYGRTIVVDWINK